MSKNKINKNVLTIAGSDPSGGAGVQADLRVFHALGVKGLSAITAVTAQNAERFYAVNPVSARILGEQLDALWSRHKIDAIKIGMLGTAENVVTVCRFLKRFTNCPIILDPVFRSSTGAPLLDGPGIIVLKRRLLPLSTLVTPNLDEAEILIGKRVRTVEEMKAAARLLHDLSKKRAAILVKGGHLRREATDVLYTGRHPILFQAGKKTPRSVHGTGCILSAAIAAHLALGYTLEKSAERSKAFVTSYLANKSL